MREQRKRLVGTVISDKMDKTIVVEVATTRRHKLYGKVISLVKKYKVHDEQNEARVGDR
ncbi:MAG: 30S ribosomal protein S17, partial [Chloroflexota bacterium]